MQVILLEKVKNLGQLGDKVKVRPGYGRNFLLPKEKAVMATKENIKYFEERRQDFEQKEQERLSDAKSFADKLSGITLTISAKVAEEGKLYGSVGAHEVVEAFKDKDFSVSKQDLVFTDGFFREIGEYEVIVSIHHGEVEAKVKVAVIPEK